MAVGTPNPRRSPPPTRSRPGPRMKLDRQHRDAVDSVLVALGVPPWQRNLVRQVLELDDDPAVKVDLAFRPTMEALIERSSFGTPGAKALRARTPQNVVAEVIAKIADNAERRDRSTAGSIDGRTVR